MCFIYKLYILLREQFYYLSFKSQKYRKGKEFLSLRESTDYANSINFDSQLFLWQVAKHRIQRQKTIL